MLHYMEHRIMPLQNRPYVVRYRPSGTLFINKYDLTIVFRTERWSDKDESIGTLSRIAAIHHTLCGGGVMLFCVRLKKAICEFRVVMTNQLGAT